jgi:phosphatidate cytidylyltransferase
MSELQLPQFGSFKITLDWITRPVFGVVLALVSIALIFAAAPEIFAGVMWLAALACAREWHRMVGKTYLLELLLTALTFGAALALLFEVHWLSAFAALGAGAIVQFFFSWARGGYKWWQAGGVLYVGIPMLCLVSLHAFSPNGPWVVFGLFLLVWSTDTGALFVGNLVGGPKIVPVLSPNKTWAGTIGGLVAAAIAEAVFIGILGGHVVSAILFAVVVGIVAHAGDFFESWAKRMFQLKDMGTLIPGHGGFLDRVDSTLSSVTAVAFVVFVFRFDTLFGAQP